MHLQVERCLIKCTRRLCNKEAGQRTRGPPPRQPSSELLQRQPHQWFAEPQLCVEPLFNCCFWRRLCGLLARTLRWSRRMKMWTSEPSRRDECWSRTTLREHSEHHDDVSMAAIRGRHEACSPSACLPVLSCFWFLISDLLGRHNEQPFVAGTADNHRK